LAIQGPDETLVPMFRYYVGCEVASTDIHPVPIEGIRPLNDEQNDSQEDDWLLNRYWRRCCSGQNGAEEMGDLTI
jgi:hypothetical protein